MRFKNFIAIIVVALIAYQSVTFAHPGISYRGEQEQSVQVEFITAQELKTKIASGEPVAIVDLRSQSSYAQSDKTIKGSVHTKVRKAARRLSGVPRDREVVTYCVCQSDEAAIIAARLLIASGFKRVRVLKGGWNAWIEAGGQTQPKS